ncbi:hypothetical protein evm_007495 [Chilo suppressalis]|nr:hypothetical protein evm_007495 [Chilo suppressalis]
MKIWITILFVIKLTIASPPPIVLWHGMGDTCCLPFSLGKFRVFLENIIPGVYVKSIRIGNNNIEDLENSYFMNPNKQVRIACDQLAADPKLTNGFNAIGFSQGSQFMRALVQRCGDKLSIKNLITLGGQHQGVYGLPHCGALKHKSCDYVRKIINYAAYYEFLRDSQKTKVIVDKDAGGR